jgi:hypothetical protein
MEQLEARAAVLDRQVEGAALKMKENLSEVCNLIRTCLQTIKRRMMRSLRPAKLRSKH